MSQAGNFTNLLDRMDYLETQKLILSEVSCEVGNLSLKVQLFLSDHVVQTTVPNPPAITKKYLLVPFDAHNLLFLYL